MKILIVNKSDSFGGTAVLASTESLLLQQNHDVETLFATAATYQQGTISLRNAPQAFFEKAIDFIDRKRGVMYENIHFSGTNLLKLIKKEQPDFVHIHNLHGGYLSLDILPKIAALTTLVWNINDMWPLTAHCSVTNGCEKWKTACKKCPNLETYPSIGRDTTKTLFEQKSALYQRTNFIPVVPSRYMEDVVASSPLFAGKEVVYIPLGVDTTIFTPTDTAPKSYSLLFVAEKPSNSDKGFAIAQAAVTKAAETLQKKLHFTTVTKEPVTISHPLIEHHPFPYISPEKLAEQYRKASLFLSPTAGETFGLTLIESAACGTPFLAPDNTAITEHARRLELTPVAQRSVEAFAARIIEHFSKDDISSEFRTDLAKKAAYYSQKRSIERYFTFFLEKS